MKREHFSITHVHIHPPYVTNLGVKRIGLENLSSPWELDIFTLEVPRVTRRI